TAVLQNGLGRHDLARDAARRAVDRELIGGFQVRAVIELAEAASRTEDQALLSHAHERLRGRAGATPTDALPGMLARAEALAGAAPDTAVAFRTSIEHLAKGGFQPDVARGQLLYGEWLRREGRRIEAREQLRAAHDALVSMSMAGFADRARR